jgi:hypothetical protein
VEAAAVIARAKKVLAMDYTYEQIDWAVRGVSLLPIVALGAIASFAAKSRLAFLLGSAGALLGLIVPEPVVYAQYRSAEAAYMASLTDRAEHLVFWGIAGALGAWGLAVYVTRKPHRARSPAK